MKHSILALVLALTLTGCLSSLTSSDYNQPTRIGMTEKELTDAVGKPEVITNRSDGSQVWVYSFGLGVDAKQVFYILKDGKVVDIPATAADVK